MILKFRDKQPQILNTSYVAPTAVIRGDVVIGDRTAILFGAVLTAEGGPIQIGSDCVIMEHAVLRSTPRNPLIIGDRTLVGPRSHLSGCRIESDCFVATGSAIFNGAYLETQAEVRINGVVHVNSRLPASSIVPIGWIAVGNPARLFPPDRHQEIWALQKELDFPGTVFGVDREIPKGERTEKYAAALQRQREDKILLD